MWSDHVVDKRGTMLFDQFRAFVEDLETDSITDKGGAISRHDDLAPEPMREHFARATRHLRVGGVLRDHLCTDDHLWRIE